jgi:3-hydroxymyristoyl/3-hydroxydecanoyl-(acyl carrier protein) dehydratase
MAGVDAADGELFWSVAADHPAFPGHFPGHPVVPGVVLLDQALHAICQAYGWPEAPCQVAACKFLSPVGPGETLRIEHRRQPNGSVLFDITGDGRVVASGKLAAPAQQTPAP